MSLHWECSICKKKAEYKRFDKYYCKTHWGEMLGYGKEKGNLRTKKSGWHTSNNKFFAEKRGRK